MKKLYFLLLGLLPFLGISQNVTITKIIETGCPDPFLKTVELYVDGTVDFGSEVVLNYMQNGAAWADNQIDISALGVVSDKFVYIVRDIALMEEEFPSTTFDASNTVVVNTSTNGDDGYQVVLNGVVVSQFGKTETDADDDTDSNWNHNDTVALRISGVADIGVWDPSQWEIRPENDLDDHTSCQNAGAANLETYFNTLGGTYPLGSGSGWTPTGDECTVVISGSGATCESFTDGADNDTYSAIVSYTGGDNGKTFVVSSTAGSVSGDSPTTVENGDILISNIPEGTDITVTISDVADGGTCDLDASITSPSCIPLVINEALFDPANDISGDANGDGTRDALDDEFIEFYNNSNASLDISGFTISDAVEMRHTFPASTVIPPFGVIVVFGGGTPTGDFGGALVQTASEGQLNLSNAGDVITVKNTMDEAVAILDSSDLLVAVDENQSVTRNPDITGDFELHSVVNPSALFSPGLKANGDILSTDDFQLTSGDLKLFPNPNSTGQLTIYSTNFGTIDVKAFDLLGKQHLSTSMQSSGSLNIQELKSGIYILTITQDGNTINKKLIVN